AEQDAAQHIAPIPAVGYVQRAQQVEPADRDADGHRHHHGPQERLAAGPGQHSINQPTVGSAHNRYNGIEPTRFIITCNGCDSVSRCHTPTPCSESVSANSISIRMPVTVPTTTAMNGATTVAAMTLESTVAASETGNDFQNRMLRSRRSSYNAPRQ